MSGDPYVPSLYWSGNKGYHPPDVVQKLRAEVLVPWATGKCQTCGSTLVNDPLGHRCGHGFERFTGATETTAL